MTCPHLETEIVYVADPAGGDDRIPVARICVACLEQLPLAWGCDDEWVDDVRTFSDLVPERILSRPCPTHQHDHLTGARP